MSNSRGNLSSIGLEMLGELTSRRCLDGFFSGLISHRERLVVGHPLLWAGSTWTGMTCAFFKFKQKENSHRRHGFCVQWDGDLNRKAVLEVRQWVE